MSDLHDTPMRALAAYCREALGTNAESETARALGVNESTWARNVREGHTTSKTIAAYLATLAELGHNVLLEWSSDGCWTTDSKGAGRRSPLTPGLVRKMRRDRTDGATYANLGIVYGVSDETARNVCLGRTWGHIPMDADSAVAGPVDEVAP